MCKECEKNPVYEFTNKRKLCARCFIKYFHKKVLYTIRRFDLIVKEDVVGYQTGKDFRSVVLENVLSMFTEKANVKIIKLPTSQNKQEITKIALASTTDMEASKITDSIIHGNLKDLKKEKKKNDAIIIKPLCLFLDKEVLLYAKLKGLKFKQEKEKIKKTKISEFIDELEKKHPEIKQAILKSYLKMFNKI